MKVRSNPDYDGDDGYLRVRDLKAVFDPDAVLHEDDGRTVFEVDRLVHV